MKSQKFYTAKIIYINNTSKENIGYIQYAVTSTGHDILPSIMQTLTVAGHPFTKGQGRMYLKQENRFTIFDETTSLDSKDITIIYSEVIALQNAVRYDEVDGIVFCFHTEEHSHLYFPHIHAQYAGEEIVVSLIDFQITGHFKSPKKEKIALKYVRENIADLQREWERIQALQ